MPSASSEPRCPYIDLTMYANRGQLFECHEDALILFSPRQDGVEVSDHSCQLLSMTKLTCLIDLTDWSREFTCAS